MLKKSDLAKQFELVVQQEIKNYNDSLSQIFQKLSSLAESIKSVEEQALENFALVSSQQKQLEIQIELMKKDLEANFSTIGRHVNDTDAFKKSIKQDVDIAYANSIEANRKHEHTNNTIDRIYDSVTILEDEISGYSVMINTSIENISSKLNKDLERMKKEIMNLPSDGDKVRAELEEKIASHVVDVTGIMKEIRISRKEFIIIEKKIENIYTLIERLKGGSV